MAYAFIHKRYIMLMVQKNQKRKKKENGKVIILKNWTPLFDYSSVQLLHVLQLHWTVFVTILK